MNVSNNNATFRFRGRTVVSLLTAWAFVVSGLTGLVLFIEPYGRYAFWNHWQFLLLSKTQWDGIHIISSWLFIIAGSFHLYFNWRPFLAHLRIRLKQGFQLRKELAVSVVSILIVIASGIFHIPPLGFILDLNELAKSSWHDTEADDPPFGHAELEPLAALAKRLQIDIDQVVSDLEQNNISVPSVDATFGDIARQNGVTPAQLFSIINKNGNLNRRPRRGPGKGSGMGRGRGRNRATRQ